MQVHSEVHLTVIAGIAVWGRFVEVGGYMHTLRKTTQNALAAPGREH